VEDTEEEEEVKEEVFSIKGEYVRDRKK